ncbi:hypothetical protein GGE66_003304 [Rhizobium leguminosarum]|uniref:Uncharacterized protein n=1 Tax=Rhizobium leguminosarum TaxID=384 RepID=A0A7W9ZT35_RHILE|nr:hypothetical protein [Rhizobium leguminosarum]
MMPAGREKGADPELHIGDGHSGLADGSHWVYENCLDSFSVRDLLARVFAGKVEPDTLQVQPVCLLVATYRRRAR